MDIMDDLILPEVVIVGGFRGIRTIKQERNAPSAAVTTSTQTTPIIPLTPTTRHSIVSFISSVGSDSHHSRRGSTNSSLTQTSKGSAERQDHTETVKEQRRRLKEERTRNTAPIPFDDDVTLTDMLNAPIPGPNTKQLRKSQKEEEKTIKAQRKAEEKARKEAAKLVKMKAIVDARNAKIDAQERLARAKEVAREKRDREAAIAWNLQARAEAELLWGPRSPRILQKQRELKT